MCFMRSVILIVDFMMWSVNDVYTVTTLVYFLAFWSFYVVVMTMTGVIQTDRQMVFSSFCNAGRL